MTVIIDAGHGGKDGGAGAFGVAEKDWTLLVSLYQEKRFKQLGISCLMTRTKDTTFELNARADFVKKSGAKICISNHFNASNGAGNGVETIYSIHSKNTLAESILNEVVSVSGLKKRKSFTRKNDSGSDYYAMHRLTGAVETIIVEYGFIDNKTDHEFLKKNLEKVAEATVKAVCLYLGKKYIQPSTHKEEVKTTGKLYKVQVGAFSSKANAEGLLKQLQAKGFAGVIKED